MASVWTRSWSTLTPEETYYTDSGDLLRLGSPVRGAADVPQDFWHPRCETDRGWHGLERFLHCRPGRPRDVGRRWLRCLGTSGDGELRGWARLGRGGSVCEGGM